MRNRTLFLKIYTYLSFDVNKTTYYLTKLLKKRLQLAFAIGVISHNDLVESKKKRGRKKQVLNYDTGNEQ